MPFGTNRSSYNKAIQERLPSFVSKLDRIEFKNESFENVIVSNDSFVYCDPPYLITTATYNEAGGWTDVDEKKLMRCLDGYNARGIKFALSNVLTHKDKRNTILEEWAKKYNTHFLDKNYDSCSYQTKTADDHYKTTEVLITNY